MSIPDVNTKYNVDYIDTLLTSLPKFNAANKMALTALNPANPDANDVETKKIEARQLLIDFINDPNCKKKLQPYQSKIVEIYERLVLLPRGDGTWADEIKKDLLFNNQTAETGSTDSEDLDFQELDEMILEKVFISEDKEEKILDDLEKAQNEEKNNRPEEYAIDSVGLAHTFKRVEKLPSPTNQQLFHIHADEFGSGSKLEGSQSKIVINYLHSYLSASKSIPSSPGLLEELSGALDMKCDSYVESDWRKKEMITKGKEKIVNAFESKKTLLIMGGWSGNPSGHAIYYEILPDGDGKSAALRLYNTGAGAESHRNAMDGNKIKYQSFCEWKGIERKKLESSLFLEALYELENYNRIPDSITSTSYNAPDIYNALKKNLQPEEEIEGPTAAIDGHLLMTPQRSGSCAWRSLMAFMRTKMTLADYKRFKGDIKLQSLGDYIDSHSTEVNAADWRLVKKSHQKLCRSILRLHQKGIVGDGYLDSAKTALEPISAWLYKHKECRSKRETKKISFSYQKATGNSILENKNSMPLPLEAVIQSKESDATASQSCLYICEAFKSIVPGKAEEIENNLKEVNAVAEKAWIAHEDIALHKGLINFVTNLEIDKNFWGSALGEKPERGEALITQLGELSNQFIRSCFTIPEAHIIFPEKVYVLNKLLYLQQTLYLLGHPKSEKNKIYFFSDLPDNDLCFNFSSPKMQHEMAKIDSAMNKIRYDRDHVVEFPSPYKCLKEDGIGLYTNFSESKSPFVELIRKECPEAIEKISNKVKNFQRLPKFSQDAEIFASDMLPGWAKAMRDTYFAYTYLKESSVANLSGLNRNKDLKPQFQVKHPPSSRSDDSEVVFRLIDINNDILNQPEVKEIEENSSSRYSGQYCKVTDSAIKQLFYFFTVFNKDFDKKLIYIDAKNGDMKEMLNEEFRELVRPLLAEELRIIETLEYFTKHPQKLKNPNYQTLLQVLLFNFERPLNEELKIAGRAGQLREFVEKNYERFKENNDIPTMVFLLKLAHQLKSFCPEEEFFCHATEHLQALLSNERIEPDVKNIIYSELLAQLDNKERLTDDDIATLLVGNIYMAENQANNISLDPSAIKGAREALAWHAKEIEGVLQRGSPNKLLLNKILRSLRATAEDQEWIITTKEGQFPFYSTKNGEHTLYPLLSRLVSSETQVFLPITIRKNPIFRDLFPTIEQGSYRPGDVFAFHDQHGRETLVHMNGDHIVIEQKLENGADGWFRYIPASFFLEKLDDNKIGSLIGSRYLVQQYTHWQALKTSAGKDDKEEIYAIDPANGERKYRFSSQVVSPADRKKDDLNSTYFQIEKVTRLSDGAILGKASELLTDVEDLGYIHEWYDKDTGFLKQIELPRFGLSFTPDPVAPDTLLCQQFLGYKINSTIAVKELGVHRNFILIENSKGRKKILLPYQDFKAPEEKEVLQPNYEMDRGLEYSNIKPQKYFTFDLQKKSGKLFSKAREANLYLAQVLGTAQEYRRAARYLRAAGAKLTAYTKEEARILHNISNTIKVTGDSGGNGIALQLFADYLLIKNALANHSEVSQSDIKALREHYTLYVNHISNVTACKLQADEELLIVKILLSKQFDPLFFKQLQKMAPEAAQQLQIPADESIVKKNLTKNLKGFKIPQNVYPGILDFLSDLNVRTSAMSLTRPHLLIEKNFRYFYQLARNKGNEEEKAWLMTSLYFLRTYDAGEHEGLANFFEAVLKNPQSFPDIPSGTEKAEVKEKWNKEVMAAATSLLAKMPAEDGSFIGKSGLMLRSELPYEEERAVEREKKNIDYALLPLPTIANGCKEYFKELEPEPLLSTKETESPALDSLLKSYKSEDLIQHKEIERLQEDLIAYKKVIPAPTYTINKDNIEKISRILSKDEDEDKQQMELLEKQIVALANKAPRSANEQVKNQLKKWGGLRKAISLEEVIVNFSCQEHNALLRRNPSLDDDDINNLMAMVGAFLQHATRDQQRTRCQAALEKVIQMKDCDPKEYSDLVNQLADSCLAERYYSAKQRPAYLVFEYFAHIAMRKPQVDKLEAFLTKGDLNPVMEMIMGSGKSKVLLPLLGLMRADGKALSMLIVPQPLFESISQDTQDILQGAFSQALCALHFDRHTKFTKASLNVILDDLQNIRRHRQCLIMTSKSVQCLMLKFIEQCATHFKGANSNKDFPEELKIMRKILVILSESGYPIIDEADSVLNVLHEVSFSGGNHLAPKTHELELISEIYGIIYTDAKIKELAHIDSDPQAAAQAPPFTEQLYFKKMQKPLATALIERLKTTSSFASPSLAEKMAAFFTNITDKDHTVDLDNLMHYLCRDKDHIKEAQKFFDALDPQIQDILALAGEQLSHLLPYTLTRLCDEKYGIEEKNGGFLAIPFSAANTPNSGSQFSNAHITMNYTFQAYMKKGVTAAMVEQQIALLQQKALREIAESGSKLLAKETDAGKVFAQLKGDINIPLFNYKPFQLDNIVKRINESTEAKRKFVAHIILPQMEHFETKISCNAQNLVALFGKVMGFTGTLWNGLSMHHKINLMEEAGTDAKTLSILWENSRDNAITIKEGSSIQMLDSIKEEGIAYDMISDAGGYFKDGTNSAIAQKIAANNGGKAVAFYNGSGEQTLADGGGSAQLPLNQSNKAASERLTFLDQSHTTGADISQKRNAISLVTIGRNMLLRDLLQSVWRLRGLDKSQRVRFLVSEEVANIIRQTLKLRENHPIQFDVILNFVIANQAAQQGRDNYKALNQQLANLPQQLLIKVLLTENLTNKAYLQAFRLLHFKWVKPASFSAKELYGTLTTEVESKEILERNKKECRDDINEIFTKLPWLAQIGITQNQCLKEIDIIADRIKESLPSQLQISPHTIDNDQTVEVETQTQTETEIQRETELEVQESNYVENRKLGVVKANYMAIYKSFEDAVAELRECKKIHDKEPIYTLDDCPAFSLESYLKSDKDLSSYNSAFAGIYLSINALEWTAALDDFKLLGTHRLDIHHLVIRDSDHRIIIMSQNEARNRHNNSDYYNLTLGYNDAEKQKDLPRDALFKIVKIKFLNGEAQFNNEELKLLEIWFKEQGVAKMQKLHELILAGFPKKLANYHGSRLQQLFAKMSLDSI